MAVAIRSPLRIHGAGRTVDVRGKSTQVLCEGGLFMPSFLHRMIPMILLLSGPWLPISGLDPMAWASGGEAKADLYCELRGLVPVILGTPTYLIAYPVNTALYRRWESAQYARRFGSKESYQALTELRKAARRELLIEFETWILSQKHLVDPAARKYTDGELRSEFLSRFKTTGQVQGVCADLFREMAI
jgi:hypothetical protein